MQTGRTYIIHKCVKVASSSTVTSSANGNSSSTATGTRSADSGSRTIWVLLLVLLKILKLPGDCKKIVVYCSYFY